MKKNYSDLLKSPKWQKKRLQIMSRDKFTCKLCGDTETQLHVHHKEYINGNNPWDYDNTLLITLCEDCHQEIEKLKKEDANLKFDAVRIYKSLGWDGGSKILFTSYPGFCVMTILNDDGNQIAGYNIPSFEIKRIINILKKA